MSSSLYQIDKLGDDNYDAWKVQMRAILVHSELWSYVSGSIAVPADAAAFSAWTGKDEKALATILLSVKSSQLLHVKKCKTSSEAWKKLEEVHCPSGPASKITLFKQLINLKMEENSSMLGHLNKFFDLFEKLAEIDIKLNDELLGIIMLSSLPKSYENFVIAIESRDTLPSSSVLKVKLLEEEKRRGDGVEEVHETAFLSKQRNHQARIAERNHEAHIQLQKNVRGKCYKCHKRGHYAASCKAIKTATKPVFSFAVLNATNSAMLNRDVWVLDSGTTSHMCCDKKLFVQMQPHVEKIELAADGFVESAGIGDVIIIVNNRNITLRDVLFVPSLQTNFLSISKATTYNLKVEFNDKFAVIKSKSGALVIHAGKVGDLFLLRMKDQKLFSATTNDGDEFLKWHERYGHLNAKSLKILQQNRMVHGLNLKKTFDTINCGICLQGKICQLPFPKNSLRRSKEVLELVHSDICGPMRKNSLGGSRYFILFVDDYSRKIFIYFLKHKSEAFNVFKVYKASVERETGRKLKALRTDNGREYLSGEFIKFLENEGIQHHVTAPYTPQQNGVAERANRTLVEMARCLLLSSNLPEYLWGEAVHTAVYLRNRSPTHILKTNTPYEAWSGHKPTVSHLKTFGSKAVMLDKRPGKSKFSAKGIECFMVGYSSKSKAYRLYDPKSKKIYISRDVKFLEHAGKQSINKSIYDSAILDIGPLEEINENKTLTGKNDDNSTDEDSYFTDALEMHSISDNDAAQATVNDNAQTVNAESLSENETTTCIGTGNVTQALAEDPDLKALTEEPNLNAAERIEPSSTPKSKPRLRPRKQKSNYTNFMNESGKLSSNPLTVREALSGSDAKKWIQSMRAEYNSLLSNKTWELVDLPKYCQAIKSKWVFNIKRDRDGKIMRYKSRLVAKGCSQKFGIDYNETFSPVVRYSSIRMILALAVEHHLYVHQMDIASAYLYGELEEEVFMCQPEMFVDKKNPDKVCRLKKSIYGLKQSGRKWNEKLDNVLKNIGFKRCNADTCVYTMNREQEINIIAVYVDDIILASSNGDTLNKIKYLIGLEFDVVDKGPIDYFLGMEISRDYKKNTISISQKQFIIKLLENNNMIESRKCNTPLDPGQKLAKCAESSNCTRVDTKIYQSLIGSLMYIGISTRPDILHSVSKLSQFNLDPHVEHLTAAKHVLRYLNNTKNLKLTFRKTGERLKGFADADWAGNQSDRKSYTGFVFIIAGAVFAWESRKQPTVAFSSTEAEHMALSAASREVVYWRNFLMELGFKNLIDGPTELNGDNLSSQQLVKNPVYHARSKHIDIKVHYIREVYNKSLLVLKYVTTKDMIADILTKNLHKVRHAELSMKLGITQ